MKMNSLNVVLTFGFFTLFGKTYAGCNNCSEVSFAACEDLNSFKICLDGENPSGEIHRCPANTICTDEQGICLPEDSAVPGCVKFECNDCTDTDVFTCVSQTHYGYCYLNNIETVGQCGDKEVCSMESFNSTGAICAKECDTTPTCSNTEYTTVAPTTASYTNSCTGKQTAGYYPDINDSSCKNFVYCELLNGEMNSVLRTCDSGYFDPVKQRCGNTKPSTCV